MHSTTQPDGIEKSLNYRKLDPQKHFYQLKPDTETTAVTNPFADVEDAAAFAYKLRDTAQRVRGVISPDIDPIAWQNKLREQEERDSLTDQYTE